MLLIKTDVAGIFEWEKTFLTPAGDGATDLVATAYGGFAFVGYAVWGTNEIWLVRTDALGNEEWLLRCDGGNIGYKYSLIQTGDLGFAIAGTTYSGGDSLDDAFLIKTDPEPTEFQASFSGGAPIIDGAMGSEWDDANSYAIVV